MYLPFNLEIYAEALCLDYKLKVGKLRTCMYDPRSLQLFSLAELVEAHSRSAMPLSVR